MDADGPEFLAVGGDAQQSLEGVNVPSYSIDTSGVIRWLNPAAVRLMGDVRGRQYTSVVAAEDRRAPAIRSPPRCWARKR